MRHFVPEFSTFYCDKRTGSYRDLYGVLWTRGGGGPPVMSLYRKEEEKRGGRAATEIFKTKNSDGRGHGSANTIMSNRWICEQHVFPLKCTALLILCNLLSTLNENESALFGDEKHSKIKFPSGERAENHLSVAVFISLTFTFQPPCHVAAARLLVAKCASW